MQYFFSYSLFSLLLFLASFFFFLSFSLSLFPSLFFLLSLSLLLPLSLPLSPFFPYFFLDFIPWWCKKKRTVNGNRPINKKYKLSEERKWVSKRERESERVRKEGRKRERESKRRSAPSNVWFKSKSRNVQNCFPHSSSSFSKSSSSFTRSSLSLTRKLPTLSLSSSLPKVVSIKIFQKILPKVSTLRKCFHKISNQLNTIKCFRKTSFWKVSKILQKAETSEEHSQKNSKFWKKFWKNSKKILRKSWKNSEKNVLHASIHPRLLFHDFINIFKLWSRNRRKKWYRYQKYQSWSCCIKGKFLL